MSRSRTNLLDAVRALFIKRFENHDPRVKDRVTLAPMPPDPKPNVAICDDRFVRALSRTLTTFAPPFAAGSLVDEDTGRATAETVSAALLRGARRLALNQGHDDVYIAALFLLTLPMELMREPTRAWNASVSFLTFRNETLRDLYRDREATLTKRQFPLYRQRLEALQQSSLIVCGAPLFIYIPETYEQFDIIRVLQNNKDGHAEVAARLARALHGQYAVTGTHDRPDGVVSDLIDKIEARMATHQERLARLKELGQLIGGNKGVEMVVQTTAHGPLIMIGPKGY